MYNPQGMKYIMTNFNHERLTIAAGVTRQARVALSSAFEYVLRREAFGRPLADQPVVRHRLARAGALLESQWAWAEQFAYQLARMPRENGDRELGGMTALLKAHAGVVLRECADTAVLLFGGNGYTRSGQGELVESEFFPFFFFCSFVYWLGLRCVLVSKCCCCRCLFDGVCADLDCLQ